MTKLVAISGSLRRGSFNTMLAHACTTSAPEGVTVDVKTLHGIPLYDYDVEVSEGIPAAALALMETIAAADGVILVTPEYNNSIPGVFKNAIDWLSRPGAEPKKSFAGRPFALMGASPGGFGTTLSQVAWLPVLRTLGAHAWFGAKLLVSHANNVFDDGGRLKDPAIQESLRKYLASFVEWAGKGGGA